MSLSLVDHGPKYVMTFHRAGSLVATSSFTVMAPPSLTLTGGTVRSSPPSCHASNGASMSSFILRSPSGSKLKGRNLKCSVVYHTYTGQQSGPHTCNSSHGEQEPDGVMLAQHHGPVKLVRAGSSLGIRRACPFVTWTLSHRSWLTVRLSQARPLVWRPQMHPPSVSSPP